MAEETVTAWPFGTLEAIFAAVHDIAPSKRTAFQARLKHFHRLKFPPGFATSKGKASLYGPGDIIQMALAIELTQLGLSPERVVRTLTVNYFPLAMCVTMAAAELMEKPRGFGAGVPDDDQPMSMFLYFDPSALNALSQEGSLMSHPDEDEATATFFYAGEGVLRERLSKLMSGFQTRLSLVNVTLLLDRLAAGPLDATPLSASVKQTEIMEWRGRLFREFRDWASKHTEVTTDPKAAAGYIDTYLRTAVGTKSLRAHRERVLRHLVQDLDIPKDMVIEGIRLLLEEDGFVDPET